MCVLSQTVCVCAHVVCVLSQTVSVCVCVRACVVCVLSQTVCVCYARGRVCVRAHELPCSLDAFCYKQYWFFAPSQEKTIV